MPAASAGRLPSCRDGLPSASCVCPACGPLRRSRPREPGAQREWFPHKVTLERRRSYKQPPPLPPSLLRGLTLAKAPEVSPSADTSVSSHLNPGLLFSSRRERVCYSAVAHTQPRVRLTKWLSLVLAGFPRASYSRKRFSTAGPALAHDTDPCQSLKC